MNALTVATIDFRLSAQRYTHRCCYLGYGLSQAHPPRSDYSITFFRALESFDSA